MSCYILSKCCCKNIRHSFTEKEDDLLKKLVEEYGEHDWKRIAENIGTRTPRQCRERYRNYLMPGIVNGPWSTDDDMLLYSKFSEIGPHWTIISQFFPSRSKINIKNRWAALSNKKNSKKFKHLSFTSSDSETKESSTEEKPTDIFTQKIDQLNIENSTENDMSFSNDTNLSICEIKPSEDQQIGNSINSSAKPTSDEDEFEIIKKSQNEADDKKQEILFSMIEQDLFSFNFEASTYNLFANNDFTFLNNGLCVQNDLN